MQGFRVSPRALLKGLPDSGVRHIQAGAAWLH